MAILRQLVRTGSGFLSALLRICIIGVSLVLAEEGGQLVSRLNYSFCCDPSELNLPLSRARDAHVTVIGSYSCFKTMDRHQARRCSIASPYFLWFSLYETVSSMTNPNSRRRRRIHHV